MEASVLIIGGESVGLWGLKCGGGVDFWGIRERGYLGSYGFQVTFGSYKFCGVYIYGVYRGVYVYCIVYV